MKKAIEYFQIPRHLAAAIVIASVAALSAAYISQYGFGLRPCILCLYQRIPYFVNIIAGFLAFLATFRYPRLVSLLLFLSAIVFIADAGIAGFHVGVEYGWWKGLSSCGGNIVSEDISIEELRQAITRQGVIRCDKAAWTMFGISMAGYNFLLTLALGGTVFYLLNKNKT